MGVRDRNVATTAEFAQIPVKFDLNIGASLAGTIAGGWRAPFPVKVVSAYVYCGTITDADDSVRMDVHKNGTTILSAAVDPVAADTSTAMTLSGSPVLDTGDILQPVVTTGVGDAFVGSINVVVRPYLGVLERQALKNSGNTNITV